MPQQSRRTFLKVSGSVLGGIAAGTTVTAAERTDRFIVDTRGSNTSKLESAGLEVVHDLSQVNVTVVEGAESDLEAVTDAYGPDIEVALDLPAEPQVDESATDEPYYPIQWDKQSQDIPETQAITRGEGTRVAVIDSGVAAEHPDLEHAVNEELSMDFTGDGYGAGAPYGGYHGTHVAGIIAADDRNEEGVVGSAPGTEIVDCRVFSPDELATFGDILAAMVYSAQIGCDAANLSIGAYPISRAGLGSFYGKVVSRTTTWVNRQGTLLVVSAGNDAADLQHDGGLISLPNEAPQCVSVSATGPVGFNWGEAGLESPTETPAIYTNYGTNAVDLGAPGGNYDPDFPEGWYYDLVFNTISEPAFDDEGNYLGQDDGYAWLAGTSMAAPQVTAAAALVSSVAPDSNANEVEDVLKETAQVPDGFDKRYYGSGLLDPLAAVEAAQE